MKFAVLGKAQVQLRQFSITNIQCCVWQKRSPGSLYYPSADRPLAHTTDRHAQRQYVLQEHSALLLTSQRCSEGYLILEVHVPLLVYCSLSLKATSTSHRVKVAQVYAIKPWH